MSIPSHFSAAWRKAIEHGDASGFTDEADVVAFFRATGRNGCFHQMNLDQKMHVADLRADETIGHFFDIGVAQENNNADAAARLAANAKRPRFTASSPAQPVKPAASSWAKAIARQNARMGG